MNLKSTLLKKKSSSIFFQPLLFIYCFILLSSCGSRGGKLFSDEVVNVNAFQKELYSKLKPIDSTDAQFKKLLMEDIDYSTAYAYQLVDYKPLWFDQSGLNDAGKELVSQISALEIEGLKIENYDLKAIHRIVNLDLKKSEFTTDSFEIWDILMTKNYLKAARDLLLGNEETKPKSDWHIHNDSVFYGANNLANHFLKRQDFPSFESVRPKYELYKNMLSEIQFWKNLEKDTSYLLAKRQLGLGQDSIISFIIKTELKKDNPTVFIKENMHDLINEYQHVHNFQKTGKITEGTIKSLKNIPEYYITYIKENLLKLQWIPQELGEEYIWVNISLMKMKYMKGNEALFSCNVVVGKTERKTPSLVADLKNIVFNPPWTVPPTIIKKDIHSGLQRSGTAYLKKKGLRAYDKNGKDVTSHVNTGNYKNYIYRQPPGYRNALGKIKFNLENPWHIYLHDTPHKGTFNQKYRALSSGCVRLEKAKDFAFFLLKNQMDSSKIEELYQSKETKSVKLEKVVPVYIIYLTIAEDKDIKQLIYLNDIYDK